MVTTIRTQTIWKFPFEVKDAVTLDMPIDAQVLDVQVQKGIPCIWALVDPHAERCRRQFRVYGTGHPVNVTGDHVGTFQLAGGSLVFHMFEVV